MPEPLWTPSPERRASARITAFLAQVNAEHGLGLVDYDELHQWSVDHIAAFWAAVWRYADIVHSADYVTVLDEERMPGTRWFQGARLNFAENLLRYRDERTALTFVHESGVGTLELSYRELYAQVARLAQFLREQGIGPGDRVAAFTPNRPEVVVMMLAATSLGAAFSSCSPDFGFKGVMDRFGQIEPKLLLTADGYTYNGKSFDSLARVREVLAAIPGIEHVVVIPFLDPSPNLDVLGNATLYGDALSNDATEVSFAQLPFDHPVYILYSSGTTGVPKCIVHGAGGTLLQHAKELMLQSDLSRSDALFYFTTCGWMMWNWLVSGLAVGCKVVLFDGSPSHPDLGVAWRMAAAQGITAFGTSPKFITACAKAGVRPGADHDLSALRAVLSTGAPLSVESFSWVYREVKDDLQLASIAGGTDIISCFMGGSPISPVYAGQIQKRGLGMAVEAWDAQGRPVVGQKGELVCTRPFPSMPVQFHDDPGDVKYRAAYFEFFPGVWRHGDFIEVTEEGGVIIHGRSDATLNPGGIRIGTAEIYRQVEALPEVVDSLVVGQRWEDDTRVILFVVLREGLGLDAAIRARIRDQICKNTTPRHVPARVLQITAVPRTISGKKVELAVTRILHGEPVTNRDALANPESLDQFVELPELRM